MTKLRNGFLAGLITTAVLSVIIMVMPMAGAGFFGMNLAIMGLMMTSVLHLILVGGLGGVFGARVLASPAP